MHLLAHDHIPLILRSSRSPLYRTDNLSSDLGADSWVRSDTDDIEQSILLVRGQV